MEPPPKTPSILPTLRPLFSPCAFSLTPNETQKHLQTPSFGRTKPNVHTPFCRNISTSLRSIRGSGTFFLMNAHNALVIARRLALPLMPVTFARAADCVTGLKRPTPFFFMAAALFLPAAWVARVGESSDTCVKTETS